MLPQCLGILDSSTNPRRSLFRNSNSSKGESPEEEGEFRNLGTLLISLSLFYRRIEMMGKISLGMIDIDERVKDF
ncbi:unnamed protein product [Rhizophagus irregularis]|nr:unnamed protein product [Rhizophagus irregularis]